MKIAFDGGAFQQHIAGGIYSVAVGFMNAAVALRPEISFTLVCEARWGRANDALLGGLNKPVDIIYAPVGPSYSAPRRGLTTDEPHVRFEVDGRLVPATSSPGGYTYEGPRPRERFRIVSRTSRLADYQPAGDTRHLGVSIQSITVQDGPITRFVSIHDPALGEGLSWAEPDHRWTLGCADIPVHLLQSADDPVRITVETGGGLIYPLADRVFDPCHDALLNRADSLALELQTRRLEMALLARGADLYFANHFIPARTQLLPTVAWLYDMIPVLFPGFFMGDASANFADNVRLFRGCDHVFSISESSRADLIRVSGVDPERVAAAGIDVDPVYRPQPAALVERARQRHGLDERPYVLCVGTLEPRKNHARLIEAFDRAFSEHDFPIQLVIVGKRGWGYHAALEVVERLELQPHVLFLDDVSNLELAALYTGALFAAYPSIYEGFGLPVVEAMACDCPALTSATSSMIEISGDAAYLVDPLDVGSIAKGLFVLWRDQGLRERFRRKGRERRGLFSWELSARRVLEGLDTVIAGRPR